VFLFLCMLFVLLEKFQNRENVGNGTDPELSGGKNCRHSLLMGR